VTTIELSAEKIRGYALRPLEICKTYRRGHLRPDLMAGLTVAVVAVPQTIAYASIAGLPPSYGLYTACVASIVGALWGSSRFLSTGPTNALSILVLSILAPLAAIGSPEYLAAAGVMAVMVGVLCIVFALSGFGMLVNFASRAVLLGFTGGAALLIAIGQLRHLLRLEVAATAHPHQALLAVATSLGESHLPSLMVGLGTIAVTVFCNRLAKNFPGSLVAMVGAGLVVASVGVERLGVAVVGTVSRSLPQLVSIDVAMIHEAELAPTMILGALAVAALGLVEAISIAREIARQSGERLDVDQEFIGQGMANIVSGVLGGYACSGSFTRSAVNFQAGARTQMAGVFCGLFVLTAVLAFGPFAAYLPKASLAGLIMLVAYKMIDWSSVRRIVRTSRVDTVIMAFTFASTLVFPLEFAVLAGVILSLAIYIYQSSMPTVENVVPDATYRHFVHKPTAPVCPQLAVINIRGSLFFGAAAHVEDALLANAEEHPGQHLLLLRMHGVNRCDLSGIDVLEGIVSFYRETGGDVFMVQVRQPVLDLMGHSGFDAFLGEDHFLEQEEAIETLFENVIDPSVCCYECEVRVFAECQALLKHTYDQRLPSALERRHHDLVHLNVHELEDALARAGPNKTFIDVREPEEYRAGHLAGSRSLPLRLLIEHAESLPKQLPVFLVCRSGRRSTRAMYWLLDLGFDRVANLAGGILSWKALGKPLQVE
jgi:SulP family sulfate permease